MTRDARNDHFIARTSLCLAPILIWALHFGLVYGGAHVACETSANGFDETIADVLIIILTLSALGLIATAGLTPDFWLRQIAAVPSPSPVHTFLNSVIRGLAVLAFMGVLWAGLAGFFLPLCAGR